MARTLRVIAGVLFILLGLIVGAVAVALFVQAADRPAMILAGERVVLLVGLMASAVAIMAIVAGLAALARSSRAMSAAVVASAVFVVAGFIGNYALFQEPRLVHTMSNVVIAAVLVGLLWTATRRDADLSADRP